MTEYTVSASIEVDGENPQEAAALAVRLLWSLMDRVFGDVNEYITMDTKLFRGTDQLESIDIRNNDIFASMDKYPEAELER